jgi:hypothetical protein
MYLKDEGWEGVVWIDVDQDDKCWALVNTVIKLINNLAKNVRNTIQ